MNRRIQKLIEQKAWETLTEHGYNDSQLFEQLKQKVARNLVSEQVGGGEQSVQSIDGLVFYFPFDFSQLDYSNVPPVTGTVHAGALVLGEEAFNEIGRAALERQLDEWWNSGGDIDDFVPDFTDPDFRFGLNLSEAEFVVGMAQVNFPPTDIDESREIAVMKLMQRIRSISGNAIPVSAIEGLSRAAVGTRGSRELQELLKKIRKEIRRRVERDYDLPPNVLRIPSFGDNPFFRPSDGKGGFSGKGIIPPDVRASKGGLGGGLGGPGGPGGRMAPPSRPPQQRMPGRGFGGGQGMPTPGFSPPTPPLQ